MEKDEEKIIRTAFEVWARQNGYSLKMLSDEVYSFRITQIAFEAFRDGVIWMKEFSQA